MADLLHKKPDYKPFYCPRLVILDNLEMSLICSLWKVHLFAQYWGSRCSDSMQELILKWTEDISHWRILQLLWKHNRKMKKSGSKANTALKNTVIENPQYVSQTAGEQWHPVANQGYLLYPRKVHFTVSSASLNSCIPPVSSNTLWLLIAFWHVEIFSNINNRVMCLFKCTILRNTAEGDHPLWKAASLWTVVFGSDVAVNKEKK